MSPSRLLPWVLLAGCAADPELRREDAGIIPSDERPPALAPDAATPAAERPPADVARDPGVTPAADAGRSDAPAAPPAAGSRCALRNLPSTPGPHVARVMALGDDQWLELGQPVADPRWGRARGRTWTSRMPFAPELRGAFLFGEGVHGYAKPDGHYMDDLWFYDINAHAWVTCY